MAANNAPYLEFMTRVERKDFEQQISYFDRYGDINTFHFTPPSSVFDPERVDEPMVLTGTDGVTLLFLVRCRFFTPGLTDTRADALKELQGKTNLPAHLGFFDYFDYQMYFTDRASEIRIDKANAFVTSWVARNIPCGKPILGRDKSVMPLEFRRVFKQLADSGHFDIVPEDTVAYLPAIDGATMELPGWINPEDNEDDSQWFHPDLGHYRQFKKDGWRLHFPNASTHAILKWSDHFQKLVDGDENEKNITCESMKQKTQAAIALFKKEAKEKTVTSD